MSDKTRTRKPSGAIRAGRGPTATSAAAKRSGLQGKSRSRAAERKAALRRSALAEDVAATDMSRTPVDPAPPAASDEVQARTDQADGARGDSPRGAVPNASATDTHASGTPSGGSSGPGVSGEQPAEEPGDVATRPEDSGEGATEVPRDAEAAHALTPASAETGPPVPAAVTEAAASPAPANTDGGSGPGGRQAPKRRTRATKPPATGDTSTALPEPRRRARAGSASTQALDTTGNEVAGGADATPPRRRRKTDGQTGHRAARKSDAKQDWPSHPCIGQDAHAVGPTREEFGRCIRQISRQEGARTNSGGGRLGRAPGSRTAVTIDTSSRGQGGGRSGRHVLPRGAREGRGRRPARHTPGCGATAGDIVLRRAQPLRAQPCRFHSRS